MHLLRWEAHQIMDSLRILHTGDWRLNLPCQGIAYYPEDLMPSLSNSVIESVERIIDFAILETVDILVVGGNTLDPLLAGPADFIFVSQQLERLELAGIPVIWNWSWHDRRNQWPRCFKWPSNVHQIVGDTPQAITLDIRDNASVTFVGIELTSPQPISFSWFEGMELQGAVFGVGYGEFSEDETVPLHLNNWLMSGNPYGVSSQEEQLRLYNAGSPQGRTLEETGPHGAALMNFTLNGINEFQFINTSKVEYEGIEIDASAINSPESLVTVAKQQLDSRTYDESITYVIELILTDSNCNLHSLPFVETYDDLRRQLQESFTDIFPGLILSRLTPLPADSEARSFEEEILGEFLFVTAELKERGWDTLNLALRIPEQAEAEWAELHDDLSGLRTLLTVESLGKHLLGRQDKDAA